MRVIARAESFGNDGEIRVAAEEPSLPPSIRIDPAPFSNH